MSARPHPNPGTGFSLTRKYADIHDEVELIRRNPKEIDRLVHRNRVWRIWSSVKLDYRLVIGRENTKSFERSLNGLPEK